MKNKSFVKKASVLLVLALMLLSVGAMAANTGPQTASTSVKAVATTDDLPDLTIVLVIDSKTGPYYNFETWIYNKGTGTVPAGTYIVTKFFSTPEENQWDYYQLHYPLNPGENFYTIGNFLVSDFKGEVLTAYVDPLYQDGYPPIGNPDPVYGLIKESNEDNNIDSWPLPHARSYNLFNPLFSSLSSQTQSSSSQQSSTTTSTTVSTTMSTSTSTTATTRQTSTTR